MRHFIPGVHYADTRATGLNSAPRSRRFDNWLDEMTLDITVPHRIADAMRDILIWILETGFHSIACSMPHEFTAPDHE